MHTWVEVRGWIKLTKMDLPDFQIEHGAYVETHGAGGSLSVFDCHDCLLIDISKISSNEHRLFSNITSPVLKSLSLNCC